MAQRKESGSTDGSDSVGGSEGWTEAQRKYSDIQGELALAHAKASELAQKRIGEAQRDYIAALSNIAEEVSRVYRETHATYLTRVQDAMSSAADISSAEEARSSLDQMAASLMEDSRQRAKQAYDEFTAAQDRAAAEYSATAREAYRNALRAQRDLWVGLDIERLLPE